MICSTKVLLLRVRTIFVLDSNTSLIVHKSCEALQTGHVSRMLQLYNVAIEHAFTDQDSWSAVCLELCLAESLLTIGDRDGAVKTYEKLLPTVWSYDSSSVKVKTLQERFATHFGAVCITKGMFSIP